MGNIKETFIKKYGVWEYVLFLVGVVFVGRGGYDVISLNLIDLTWDALAKIISLILFGSLVMAMPKTIVDIAKKRFSSNSKKEEL